MDEVSVLPLRWIPHRTVVVRTSETELPVCWHSCTKIGQTILDVIQALSYNTDRSLFWSPVDANVGLIMFCFSRDGSYHVWIFQRHDHCLLYNTDRVDSWPIRRYLLPHYYYQKTLAEVSSIVKHLSHKPYIWHTEHLYPSLGWQVDHLDKEFIIDFSVDYNEI